MAISPRSKERTIILHLSFSNPDLDETIRSGLFRLRSAPGGTGRLKWHFWNGDMIKHRICGVLDVLYMN